MRNFWKYLQECNFSQDYNTVFKITRSSAPGIFNQTVQTNAASTVVSTITCTTGEQV